ncbi:MAG: metal-binding protein [Clostridia bacterium]|nr:metal-binding protein [Clostridia bacterium]
MTQPSHAFFSNTACRYYPCHSGLEELNCLFCFCPLYHLPQCPGTPVVLETDGGPVRDCSACTFVHRAEHYDAVIACLRQSP